MLERLTALFRHHEEPLPPLDDSPQTEMVPELWSAAKAERVE